RADGPAAAAGTGPGPACPGPRRGRAPAGPKRCQPLQRLGGPRGELGDDPPDAGAAMAVRRPPAPRLRSGRPGATGPLHPARLPSAPPAAAPPVPSPAASASPPGPTSAADPGPTSAAGAAPAQGPRRRALLLAGSAAAVI